MSMSDTSSRIADVYSQTLFELAVEQEAIEAVKDSMDAIDELLKSDESFMGFMTSPYFTSEQKLALAERIFAGRLDELTLNFLSAAIAHHRAEFLPNIIAEYGRLYRRHHKYLDVRVTVSQPMEWDAIEALKIAIIKLSSGGRITLETEVNPSIIGGVIIRCNDTVIDNSVKKRLRSAVETIMSGKSL
ncbi:MAG: ATP synthase F1 subunit delta [Planctomycetes bacterium GWC2_45_44]|nr:MAG: ATP synthase F1 subunit delta [Planctomycetes bacterium GWC2_45_44]